MAIGRIILISILVGAVYAHPHHDKPKVERGDRTYSVELDDRVVSVHRLKDPPPKKVKRRSEERNLVPNLDLVLESFFVQSTVCEDGRTYLEWWSLAEPSRGVHKAWSNLNWGIYEPLSSFQSGRRKYAVMHMPSVSTKAALAKLGKPSDPLVTELSKKNNVAREVFSIVGDGKSDSRNLDFMRTYHKQLEKGGLAKSHRKIRKGNIKSGRIKKMEKKQSTLRYWRSK